MGKPTAQQIDAILPQTQCGLCGYGGCMPYADALVNANAAIDLCPPGGVDGLKAIASLMNQDATPFVADMQKKTKPKLLAIIREDICIGCTKCIQACPVDAILGGPKLMHTVITSECTGCELCVAPCPVDCIDLVPAEEETGNEKQQKADHARERYHIRQKRLATEQVKIKSAQVQSDVGKSKDDKQSYIQQALERAKLKKGLA